MRVNCRVDSPKGTETSVYERVRCPSARLTPSISCCPMESAWRPSIVSLGCPSRRLKDCLWSVGEGWNTAQTVFVRKSPRAARSLSGSIRAACGTAISVGIETVYVYGSPGWRSMRNGSETMGRIEPPGPAFEVTSYWFVVLLKASEY